MPKRASYPKANYQELGKAIRQQILMKYEKDSCIATARATVDTLRALNVDAYALTCQVVVVNQPVYEYALATGVFPEVGADDYPELGYAVGIGYSEGEPQFGKWNGHLVTIAERRWMLDYSIDLVNDEIYGIKLEPLVVPVNEDFLRGKVKHLVYRHGDVWLYYSAKPSDKSFEGTPNWSGDTRPHVHVNKPRSNGRRVR